MLFGGQFSVAHRIWQCGRKAVVSWNTVYISGFPPLLITYKLQHINFKCVSSRYFLWGTVLSMADGAMWIKTDYPYSCLFPWRHQGEDDRIPLREYLLLQHFSQMGEKPPFIIFPGLMSFSRFLSLLLCVLGSQSQMPRVNTLNDSKLLRYDRPQASAFRAQQLQCKIELLSSEKPAQYQVMHEEAERVSWCYHSFTFI